MDWIRQAAAKRDQRRSASPASDALAKLDSLRGSTGRFKPENPREAQLIGDLAAPLRGATGAFKPENVGEAALVSALRTGGAAFSTNFESRESVASASPSPASVILAKLDTLRGDSGRFKPENPEEARFIAETAASLRGADGRFKPQNAQELAIVQLLLSAGVQ